MPTDLWTVWERTVAAEPRKPVVFDAHTGHTLTSAELTAAALALRDAAPRELAAGQTVAFSERNGPRWLAVFLALQKLDAAALPLDAALPAAQQAAAAAALGAHWLWQDDGGWQWLGNEAAAPTAGEGICVIKTTSGSTGRPQPLACTSANMLADGHQIAATMGIGPEDINLGAIPFGHSYGLGNLVLPLIAQGTALVCSTEMWPDALSEQIERFQATVFPSVPTVLRALAESGVEVGRMRSLRRVISAGAPMPPAVAARFGERFGRAAQNFYGSSETGGICFDRTGEATATGRSIGQPLEGVEVRLDEENRVVVRSAAVVAPGEWTLTDLGAWSQEGELILTGRAVPLANIGGKKVSPAEIERALRALAGVTDAWVGVRTRAEVGGGDFLLAAIETERGQAEILRELAAQLPTWQIPRRLWVAAHLPRTGRGKLDRQELEVRCLGNGKDSE
jgi:acyl-CoA synthetase (AMP-forming)/AMP-acid ligase II